MRLLNANDVRYLLVGGYAVAYHGYPRYTNDIDLWVDADRANAEKVLRTISDFGFPVDERLRAWAPNPQKILRIGEPPLRIEIMTTIAGVSFADAYDRRIDDRLDGVDVRVIGLDDLKANKAAAGRHKDLDDLEHL